MSDLLLPPWDLCGFDRGHNPHAGGGWQWWGRAQRRWLCEFYPDGTMASQVVVDPNKRDGEWPELAFMPHAIESVPNGVERVEVGKRIAFRAKWLEVPAYLNVLEALVREQVLREERRQMGVR